MDSAGAAIGPRYGSGVRRLALIGLIAATCLALAACGESSLSRIATAANEATTTTGTTTSGTTTTGPSTTVRRSGLARKTPRDVLAATADAMEKVRSYHVESEQVDDDGPSSIVADVTADGRFRGRLRSGDRRVEVVVLGADTYMKANRAYWDDIGGRGAPHLSLLSDRWVKAPSAAAAGLRDTLDKLEPEHIATCLRKGSTAKGVTNEGERRWRGKPVVVLRDPGRLPGSSPSELYTAARGAPLVQRETQSGRRRPGGQIDRECGDPQSTTRRGETEYSRYDVPVKIEPPPNALDLDRLAAPKDLTPA